MSKEEKKSMFHFWSPSNEVLLFRMTHLVKVVHHVPCNMSHYKRERAKRPIMCKILTCVVPPLTKTSL